MDAKSKFMSFSVPIQRALGKTSFHFLVHLKQLVDELFDVQVRSFFVFNVDEQFINAVLHASGPARRILKGKSGKGKKKSAKCE